MSAAPFVIVFAIFQDLTQLDFTGPWEVLSRLPDSQVIVASRDGGAVRAQHGLTFEGTKPLAEVERCDLICIPGGPGTARAMLDEAFIGEVRRLAAGARYVTSVCTGSLVLGAAGLLKGRRAACHWASRRFLEAFGAIASPERVCIDGALITGGGVTAGIDFGLTIAAEVAGRDVAEFIQLSLEYSPDPPFGAGSPETAPAELTERYLRLTKAWTEEREAAVRRAARSLV